MAESIWRVRDELWEVVEPLLPEQPERPKGGRPRVDDRLAFDAIVFVLITGIAWRHLPPELGCSGATAHRRLQQWQRAGVFDRLHRELLRRLNRAGRIDWEVAAIDGSQIRALQGGVTPAPRQSTARAPAPSTTC